MATLGKIAARKPPATVLVQPNAWKDGTGWADRPRDAVCMGLRLVSNAEIETSRAFAAEHALKLHPRAKEHAETFGAWVETYNDALLRRIVAYGTCDANDVGKPWPGWAAGPELVARDQLTPGGAAFIFDHWERMRIETDPSVLPISDDELFTLIGFLDSIELDEFERRDRPRALRVRRLLRFCLDELTAA